jgi:hypothetical protein
MDPMAGSAQPDENKSPGTDLVAPVPPGAPGSQETVLYVPKDDVQLVAARLYGQGLKRKQIVHLMLDLLAPVKRQGRRDRTHEERVATARGKLRRWENNDDFRDLVYENAVVELDKELPQILKGIGKRGRTRVDAARLALEVTGRHNPKGEQQPTQVVVQIAHIPRPGE